MYYCKLSEITQLLGAEQRGGSASQSVSLSSATEPAQLLHHFLWEMIYRRHGHKQHNSLTNTCGRSRAHAHTHTQWLACRLRSWHPYCYKSRKRLEGHWPRQEGPGQGWLIDIAARTFQMWNTDSYCQLKASSPAQRYRQTRNPEPLPREHSLPAVLVCF